MVESKGVKKPRTAKGLHTSRNAYMLVYQRKSDTVEGESLYPKFNDFWQYFYETDINSFINSFIAITNACTSKFTHNLFQK